MKKTILTIVALCATLALLLTLGACKIDLNNLDSTATYESTADNKDGSKALIDEFFDGTLQSGNFVATTVMGGDTRVESVVGDASCTVDSASGNTFWGFKRGEEYISACAYGEDDSHYYMTGENYYNSYYCYFMTTVRLIDYFTDEDGTFSCVIKTEEATTKGVTESTSTLTFDFVTENGTINITASAKNNLVQEFTYTMHDNSEGRTVTTVTTFTYGNATVELPDISDWADVTADYDSGDDGDSDEEFDEVGEEG